MRIRMDVRGSRPGYETFADDGSSYGLVGSATRTNRPPADVHVADRRERLGRLPLHR
jgi:hypothetical protein